MRTLLPTICFLYLFENVENHIPQKSESPPQEQATTLYNISAIPSLFPNGKCPHLGRGRNSIENAANFLVHQAFKLMQLSITVGDFIMNEEVQNSPRVDSDCGYPFRYSQAESKCSEVYYCHIIVRDLCYDFKHTFRFEADEVKRAFCYNKLEFVATIGVNWRRYVEVIANSSPFYEEMSRKVHFSFPELKRNALFLQLFRPKFNFVSCQLR